MAIAKQSSDTFENINQLIWKHLSERDWTNLPPRAVAISLALEASELLEHYQWTDEPVGDKDALASELADIFIYGFEFAQTQDIDIAAAIRAKLAKTAAKYPAEEFKAKTEAERHSAWVQAKTSYKKTGL